MLRRTHPIRALPAAALFALGGISAGCTTSIEPSATPSPNPATSAAAPSPPQTSTTTTTTTTAPAPLPASMKGWELYSWPVDGEWHFTLAVGTNRGKTVDEIMTKSAARGDAGLVDVVGVEALAAVLGRLAPGTDVLWVGGVDRAMASTSRPPADIVEAVQRRAADFHVQVIATKPS